MRAPDPSAAAPARLREQQFALARHLRDPDTQPAPGGIEQRRLAVYRELLFNNIRELLSGNFPVIHKLLGETLWTQLVRAFYRDHRCRTPLFPEIAREFVDFLQARMDEADGRDPPFLAELAHYEWVELALQISGERPDDVEHQRLDEGSDHPARALLDGAPVLSPLAWPFAYRWPVHRLAPGHVPEVPPDTPTLLLLRRLPDGDVRFAELSPLAFRLLQRLAEFPALSGRDHLQALSVEAGRAGDPAFIEQGAVMLAQMHASGIVLGIGRADPAG